MNDPTKPGGVIAEALPAIGDDVAEKLMKLNGGNPVAIVIHAIDVLGSGVCSTTNLQEQEFVRLALFVAAESVAGAALIEEHDLNGRTAH